MKKKIMAVMGVVGAMVLSGCSSTPKYDWIPDEEPSRYSNMESYVVFGERYHILDSSKGYDEVGEASWYGKKFHGRLTSNREVYDMYKVSAAHKTLPLPSYVEVTNLDNGKKLVVRVNDRGPFHDGRIIDLSYKAAKMLGVVEKGVQKVRVVALEPYQTRKK